MVTKTDTQPPETIADVLSLAIEDCRRIYNMSGGLYVFDMGSWHDSMSDYEYGEEVSWGRTCHVCMAGAIMAGTLEAEQDEDLLPEDFPLWENVLLATNSIREGDFVKAAVQLNPVHRDFYLEEKEKLDELKDLYDAMYDYAVLHLEPDHLGEPEDWFFAWSKIRDKAWELGV